MADQRRDGTDDRGTDGGRQKKPEPIPRDMPDQQFHGREDPWDLPGDRRRDGERPGEEDKTDKADKADEAGATNEADDADEELPETDESGTGRRGAPLSGGVHPDHPVPDEPPA